MRSFKSGLTAMACLGLVGFAMPAGTMPPNTVMLSQMMRQLSTQPGFTASFLKEIQAGGHRTRPALLTPKLIDHLGDLILGEDFQRLDRFPGWTMAEINPTVRVVGHIAGKEEKVDDLATAGGRPATPEFAAADDPAKVLTRYIDLPASGLDGNSVVDFQVPATGKGFNAADFVSSLGDEVTRGDGPNPLLAPNHAESQRLADVLNRLSLNGMDGVAPATASWNATVTPTTAEGLIEAIMHAGQEVTVTDSRYFANFGHLHYKGQDVMTPFFVNSQIVIPGSHPQRPLLVPVAHAEYEWHIRGPLMNADVSFYFGIDGKAEFRTMDQQDQAWVMKRDAHTYRQTDVVEVTRLAAGIVRTYMRLHQAHPAIPFGGYYAFGVCQDVIAAIELKMTGKATLFPNTADDGFFTGPNADPRDAEINQLILRLPKDRSGKPPEIERVFASLPVGESNAELASVTIPALGDDLIAVHDAWVAGEVERTQSGLRRKQTRIAIAAGVALLIGLGAWWKWRAKRKNEPPKIDTDYFGMPLK